MSTITVSHEIADVRDEVIEKMTALDKQYENVAQMLVGHGYYVTGRRVVIDNESGNGTSYKLEGNLTIQPVKHTDAELKALVQQCNEDWEVSYSAKVEGVGGKTIITLS